MTTEFDTSRPLIRHPDKPLTRRETETRASTRWVPILSALVLAITTWLLLAALGAQLDQDRRLAGATEDNFWATTWPWIAPLIGLAVGVALGAIGLASMRRRGRSSQTSPTGI